MKIYLELRTEPDHPADPETIERAQIIADVLQITVQLTNGNYGSWFLNPREEQASEREEVA